MLSIIYNEYNMYNNTNVNHFYNTYNLSKNWLRASKSTMYHELNSQPKGGKWDSQIPT